MNHGKPKFYKGGYIIDEGSMPFNVYKLRGVLNCQCQDYPVCTTHCLLNIENQGIHNLVKSGGPYKFYLTLGEIIRKYKVRDDKYFRLDGVPFNDKIKNESEGIVDEMLDNFT